VLGDLVTMSKKELTRLEIIQRVEARTLKQYEAAKQLGITARQIRRLLKKHQEKGPAGLVSKRRGKPGNRGRSKAFKEKVMKLVSKHYYDFGPTLAVEKLDELHNLSINKETLRQWMIADELWKEKRRKKVVTHQQRLRRSRLGELVQIDGSPHDWFEGRGPKCCLLVFIDDATSKVMELLFVPTETTQGYMDGLRNYIKHHGLPLAFYSDKHGIFRINIAEASSGTGETQLGRALRELDIKLIHANSPQAKGRVERSNLTHQDRLVKELRLRGISDIEAANAYLPDYLKAHNEKFAVAAASPENSHRLALPSEAILNLILSHQEERILSKNLELSYKNVIYQIIHKGQGYAMRRARVTVCENKEKEVKLLYKNKLLAYKILDKKNQREDAVSAKEINQKVDRRYRGHKPNQNHPWHGRYGKIEMREQQKTA